MYYFKNNPSTAGLRGLRFVSLLKHISGNIPSSKDLFIVGSKAVVLLSLMYCFMYTPCLRGFCVGLCFGMHYLMSVLGLQFVIVVFPAHNLLLFGDTIEHIMAYAIINTCFISVSTSIISSILCIEQFIGESYICMNGPRQSIKPDNISNLTLPILMDFPMLVDRISMELPISYVKGFCQKDFYFLFLQSVQNLMKYRIRWYFIWVFTVYQSIYLQVSPPQNKKG